jgi:hypothetical protein
MKIYATTISEKAKKGQGGNKDLLTVFTAEIDKQRQEIMSVSMLVNDNGDYDIEIRDPEGEKLEYIISKGKKQKDEKIKCFRCNDNGCPACDGTKGSQYNPEPF